mgnify:CR=1 FL=1
MEWDGDSPPAASPEVEAFIARWQGREGGQERANYALYLSELCDVLGVARPDPPRGGPGGKGGDASGAARGQ